MEQLAVSVVIPTRGRAQRLATCLQRLARQSLAGQRYEVLVGFDGPDDVGPAVASAAWTAAGGERGQLQIAVCPRGGLAAVRNALLPFVRGKLLLSLNDDLLAEPQLLQRHVEGHERLSGYASAVVVGDSPWVVRERRSVFEAMLEGTSMVFFYHRMRGEDGAPDKDVDRDWGFRHAWGLNMSMPMDAVRRVGGFTQYPSWYGYEDNEIAFKMRERLGACPVVFVPGARGWHDHAMTPREYVAREYKLGYAALGFARTSGACSLAMFRRDILSEEEQAKCVRIASEGAEGARALMEWFEGLAQTPATMENSDATQLARAYDRHLPLKRWAWNAGLRDALEDASEGRGGGDVGSERLWGGAVGAVSDR